MVGAFPQSPIRKRRSFDEFAQDEAVEMGRNDFLGTVVLLTTASIRKVAGFALKAAPIIKSTFYTTIQVAQSFKRRAIEFTTRTFRQKSLALPSVPISSAPPTPQADEAAMEVRLTPRLEQQDQTARQTTPRSLRPARHQDFSLVRPVVPASSSSHMLHRFHGIRDHPIRKPLKRLPEWTRRRRIEGWRPSCHKGPRAILPPVLSPNAKQALARKLFNNTTIWIDRRARTSTASTGFANHAPRSLLHNTPPLLFASGSTEPQKSISKSLFDSNRASFDARTALPITSASLITDSHITIATGADFPSDDESDDSYAPSNSSSDESVISEYEDLTSDEDITAVDQGLYSPVSHVSDIYGDDSPSSSSTSPQEDLASDQAEQVLIQDVHDHDHDHLQSDQSTHQGVSINAPEDQDHSQGDRSIYQNVVFDPRERDKHETQEGEAAPIPEDEPSLWDAIVEDNDGISEISINSIDAQWQRELNHPGPEEINASIEAQWQRELLPIRSIHLIPSPTAPTPEATPAVPVPTTSVLRITTPNGLTPTDAHESAKSKRRYELRTRTVKSHQTKEEKRIKAEEARKEQARLEKEKRLAKKRAKEEEAAARRARDEAENAEWILRGSRDKALTNLVQPVDEEWEKKVRAEMTRGRGVNLATSVTGQPLTRYAFGTLLPGPNDSQSAWLNDEIVTAYLDLVCAHGNNKYGITVEAIKKKTEKPKYAAFATQFMTTLRGPRGYSAVSRWAGRKQIGGKDMLGCEYVFVPVHVNQNHWTMLIISPARRTVEYFDSFGHDGTVYTNAIMGYLRDELKESFVEDEWRVWSSAESAVQQNARDCGVFSVTTAKAVTLGFMPKIAFAQKDMGVQRMRMAAELMNGGFIETGKKDH